MITPMVARLVRDPVDREGWLFELKWDGFRTIAETDGTDGVKLYSRNQSDFKKRFPPIANAGRGRTLAQYLLCQAGFVFS
jgi:bifunctional non-homologous end joining protein LigD